MQGIIEKREEYRIKNNLPKIEDYGFSKKHNKKSEEIYDFISEVDFANGDAFIFKKGGDGDNGELLMDLLDKYFEKIEKQNTPMKPIPDKKLEYGEFIKWNCPSCKKEFYSGFYFPLSVKCPNKCIHCEQEIDWREE